ncbi:MAG TPA: LD-carboxypeptidase [bacterium]|nr:LD-carboxypeptidase [bacterium]
MKRFKALEKGDTIGVAAPSSPFDRTRFMKGVRAIERMGFQVHHRSDIFDQNRYLAGTDARRAEELSELLCDKRVRAVMFARGGYGSQRIIPLLDSAILSECAKPVVGFSDLTALLAFLRQRCNLPTFYGPVVTQIGACGGGITALSLSRALTTAGPMGKMPMGKAKTINPGEASGPVVGGCLSLINSSLGTPYALEAGGAILFIEEINEKVYVLDRMLTQLKNSGMLRGVSGILFGSILPPKDEPHDIESMIRDVLSDFAGPVVMDYPAGHIEEFVTLPIGAEARLHAPEGAQPSLEYTSGLLS